MKKSFHISWENFCSTVLVPGEKRVHKISESPRVDFFWNGYENRLGLWLETAKETVISPDLMRFSFLTLRVVTFDNRRLFEISTTSSTLARQFYHFAIAISERMVAGSTSAIDAVAAELKCFGDLLTERATLGIERQIGLLGELLFLERLVAARGIALLDSWVGPEAEPHDFRINKFEFEVKTSIGTRRIHTINGSEQLVPSKDCTLFLVSLLLGPPGAGNGFSLASKVSAMEQIFASSPKRLAQFSSALEKLGLHKTDLPQYQRKFTFRRPFAVVPINAKFPALTRPAIQESLGPLAQRIESLQYDVNVEGLEKEDGTPDFSKIIPSKS